MLLYHVNLEESNCMMFSEIANKILEFLLRVTSNVKLNKHKLILDVNPIRILSI